MVEEIHMLETRGGSLEAGQDPINKDGNSANEGTSSRPNNDHQLSMNVTWSRVPHFGSQTWGGKCPAAATTAATRGSASAATWRSNDT